MLKEASLAMTGSSTNLWKELLAKLSRVEWQSSQILVAKGVEGVIVILDCQLDQIWNKLRDTPFGVWGLQGNLQEGLAERPPPLVWVAPSNSGPDVKMCKGKAVLLCLHAFTS